jgi:hypothetical protein
MSFAKQSEQSGSYQLTHKDLIKSLAQTYTKRNLKNDDEAASGAGDA